MKSAFCVFDGWKTSPSASLVWTAIGDRVAALHLYDNDGLSDDHLPPGTGTFDFKWLMTQLRNSRTFPLMDFELDLSQAEKGRSYLEPMLQPAGL